MTVRLIIGIIAFLITNIATLYVYKNDKGCIIKLMKAWSIFGIVATIIFVLYALVYYI